MIVELVSVGTEILLGNIVNTNAAYLAEQCAKLGLSLYYQVAVGDNESRMKETIKTALERSDIIILSGGLGPTQDDLTKEIAAEAANKKLVEDSHSRELIEQYLTTRGFHNITENNWKQALVPEGAIVIDNKNGTAPGLIIETDEGKRIILLPGPPGELKPMFEEDIYPYLNKLQPGVIRSRMVKICGMGESYVADQIGDLIDEQSNPTVAPYAKEGEVHLRVTAKADDETEALKMIDPVVDELINRFGEYIYTTDEETTLEAAVIGILREKGMTLSTAESCTGGRLCGTLVNVAGASDVVTEGYITYANEAKMRLLGVKEATLQEHGAVSEQTAREMAEGGRIHAGTDVCVAITGIAGPGGGTEEKPVGLVYIGCATPAGVEVKEYHFLGNREKIRQNAVVSALTFMRACINK